MLKGSPGGCALEGVWKDGLGGGGALQEQLCSVKPPGQVTQVRAKSLAGCFWHPLAFSYLVSALA